MSDDRSEGAEAALIRQAQQGDPAAFEQIYEQHQGQVFRYILYRVRDVATAEDLTSEVFVRLVERSELLAVAQLQGTLPPRVVLWGMQPLSLGWGTSLSSAVSGALDALVDHVAAELRAWGHDLAIRGPETAQGRSQPGTLQPLSPPPTGAAR